MNKEPKQTLCCVCKRCYAHPLYGSRCENCWSDEQPRAKYPRKHDDKDLRELAVEELHHKGLGKVKED